jgi:predicted nucleic acid-binding protein
MLAIDTNILIRRRLDAATVELFRLHETGKVNLEKTDTLDAERIRTAGDDGEARRRLLESIDLIEVLGPMRLDHSRLDHSVLASPSDEVRDDEVFRLIFGRDRTPASRRNDVADAHHVATCIRYALCGFVTRDKRLLRASPSLNALAMGLFHVLTPEQAVDLVRRRAATNERARALLAGLRQNAN